MLGRLRSGLLFVVSSERHNICTVCPKRISVTTSASAYFFSVRFILALLSTKIIKTRVEQTLEVVQINMVGVVFFAQYVHTLHPLLAMHRFVSYRLHDLNSSLVFRAVARRHVAHAYREPLGFTSSRFLLNLRSMYGPSSVGQRCFVQYCGDHRRMLRSSFNLSRSHLPVSSCTF